MLEVDISNVFVIVGKEWTKEKVVDEIVAEGYKHNFTFNIGQNFTEMVKCLNISNEIWLFGDCDGLEIFKYVERNGFEIWRMG